MAGAPELPQIYQLHTYKGIVYPNVVLDSSIDAMQTFSVRPDDVWIVTYPKSGTHWMMEIVGLIHARGVPENINRSQMVSAVEMINTGQTFPHTREEELKNPPDRAPFMDVINKAPSPRVILTHLALEQLPPTLKTGKVIYVARNAKDTITSFYNFVGKSPFNKFTWESILQDFMEGKSAWGPWPEHVRAFWDIKDENNVLFLFYEDMKMDPLKGVRKVADHLNVQLSEEELQKVVEHSSFSGMKKSYEKADEGGANVSKAGGHFSFMHKGVAGAWKSRFTVAQNEIFDEWYHEKMAGSDISFQSG